MIELMMMGGKQKKPFVFFTASDTQVTKTDTANGENQFGEVWQWTSPEPIRGIVADAEGGVFVATKGTQSFSGFIIRRIVDGTQVSQFSLVSSNENNVFDFTLGENENVLYVSYRPNGSGVVRVYKYVNESRVWTSSSLVGPNTISCGGGKLFAASFNNIAEINTINGDEVSRSGVNGSNYAVHSNSAAGTGCVVTTLVAQSFSGNPLSLQSEFDTPATAREITSDSSGNLIVCHNSDLIQKFDSNLNLVWEYTQNNVFQRIAATCDEDGNVYSISNGGANAGTIKVLDSSGNEIDDVKTPVNFDNGFEFIDSYQEWRQL